MSEEVLTVNEAAQKLRCSKWLIYELIEKEQLLGYRVGTRIRIWSESVEAYITRRNTSRARPAVPSDSRRRKDSLDSAAMYDEIPLPLRFREL